MPGRAADDVGLAKTDNGGACGSPKGDVGGAAVGAEPEPWIMSPHDGAWTRVLRGSGGVPPGEPAAGEGVGAGYPPKPGTGSDGGTRPAGDAATGGRTVGVQGPTSGFAAGFAGVPGTVGAAPGAAEAFDPNTPGAEPGRAMVGGRPGACAVGTCAVGTCAVGIAAVG